MGYFPLLDPTAFRGRELFTRRNALVAASAIKAMAQNDGRTLEIALGALGRLSPGHHGFTPTIDGALLAELKDLPEITYTLGQTQIDEGEYFAHLTAQLREIKSFAEIDGDTVENSIATIRRLLISGRVELFVGYMAELMEPSGQPSSGMNRGSRSPSAY